MLLTARRQGKAELARRFVEDTLDQGKTIIIAKPGNWTKRRRIKRNGRTFDVIETLKEKKHE